LGRIVGQVNKGGVLLIQMENLFDMTGLSTAVKFPVAYFFRAAVNGDGSFQAANTIFPQERKDLE
jgi:hypothetical protein